MAMRYRLLARMDFDNEADRDTWYNAVKTAVVNAKGSQPPYLEAIMHKQEFIETEPDASESI